MGGISASSPQLQKRNWTWLYFLLPSIVIMLLFFIYPILLTFFIPLRIWH